MKHYVNGEHNNNLLQPEKHVTAWFWTFELLIFRPVVNFHVSYQCLLEIELPITLKICELSILTIILEYGNILVQNYFVLLGDGPIPESTVLFCSKQYLCLGAIEASAEIDVLLNRS